jgi:hypothetical protein
MLCFKGQKHIVVDICNDNIDNLTDYQLPMHDLYMSPFDSPLQN